MLKMYLLSLLFLSESFVSGNTPVTQNSEQKTESIAASVKSMIDSMVNNVPSSLGKEAQAEDSEGSEFGPFAACCKMRPCKWARSIFSLILEVEDNNA